MFDPLTKVVEAALSGIPSTRVGIHHKLPLCLYVAVWFKLYMQLYIHVHR